MCRHDTVCRSVKFVYAFNHWHTDCVNITKDMQYFTVYGPKKGHKYASREYNVI